MTRRSPRERLERYRAELAQLEAKTEDRIHMVEAEAAARVTAIQNKARARIARLQESARNRRGILLARTEALEARQTAQSRQDDSRRKILLGSLLLLSIERADRVSDRRRVWVSSKLPDFLVRKGDMDLFPDLLGTGLPVPSSPRKDARRRILLGSLILATLDAKGVREWLTRELPAFLKPTDHRLFPDILDG